METRTKERLTGALILVALFVILVPELLSGGSQRGGGEGVPDARPASEGPPLVTYRMPLQEGAESATGQAALNVLPSQQADHLPPPVPTAPPQEPAAKPAPVETPPASSPAPAAAAAVPASPPPASAAPAPVPATTPSAAAPADKKPAVAQSKPVQDKPARTKPDKAPEKAPEKGWFVQLGVFAKRENAEQLVKQVGKKGQTAHITGSGAALRVRVGPVADRTAAQALKKRLAADGFNGTLVAP